MTARSEVVERRIAETPPLYRQIMVKAYAGSCSPRQAIKAACLHCVGYERDAITHCSGWNCPLWPLRPYQNEGGAI